MRASVRSLLLVASLLAAREASAQVRGAYLPPAPQGPGGEDVVETASGARCRQSMNSNRSYLDVGLMARQGSSDVSGYGPYAINPRATGEALGYARVTVPLGRKPQRIDCNRLYELEIQRMQQEIDLLKMNAE